MDGTARLAAFVRAHPEMEPPFCVEGIWRAWLPIGANGGGVLMYGHTEDELAAKLEDVA